MTDPNPGNNNASDTDTLTPQADLSVTKTDGKSRRRAGHARPPTPSRSATPAPSTVSSVNLTDAVPAGAAQPGLRHAQPRAATTRRTGVWSGLSLAAGQSVTITLTGTIDPAATGP